MQVTVNSVILPQNVIDAYIDTLNASITPIFTEDSVPAKAQEKLLVHAAFAATKSICMKFAKEIEEAGLYEGVVSIDFPSFKWTKGLKFCYAVDMFDVCVIRTLARAVFDGRDISSYLDYLAAWHDLRIDKGTSDLLENIEGPAARRLEEHALGLAKANETLMVGATPLMMLNVLNNVKARMDKGEQFPLDGVAHDLEYLAPNQVIYL